MTKLLMTGFLILGVLCLTACSVYAKTIDLARSGKTAYTIVCSENAGPAEKYAARELADYLEQITGAKFPIATESRVGNGHRILLGSGEISSSILGRSVVDGLGREEFIIRTVGKDILLIGGGPQGTLYSVYHLLDNVFGVRWWAPDATFVPKKRELRIEPLNLRLKPAFDYRQVWFKCALDQDWAVRNRGNALVRSKKEGSPAWPTDPDEEHGGPYLVYPKGAPQCHTFDYYVPAAMLTDHPEWFSLVNGKRVAGQYTGQLCLSNPEVLEHVVERIREDLKKDPKANIVSVTQNDNVIYCRCPECAKIDEEEGSPSGIMLRFVNSIAERLEADYPNVMFDTFAYQYTRKAPRITRPRHNVLVRLCSIECSFAQPLTDPINKAFVGDLEAWAELVPQLYVWDYVANFAVLQRPYPNLYVLGPNLRLFAENRVKHVLEQGIWQSHSDLEELKSWVLSRLLWDPRQDDRALISEFVNGYYGEAAPFIREYIDLIHSKMEGTKYHMCFYDQGNAPLLTAETMSKAELLFRQAEAVAVDQPEVLRRVKRAHLAVQMPWLINYTEWSKEAKEKDYLEPVPALELLALFAGEAKAAGATHAEDSTLMEKFIADTEKRLTTRPTAVASSYYGLQYADLAFDGDPKTGWSAPGFGPEWIMKDLGKVVKVSAIHTNFFASHIRTVYKIEASIDGETWNVIVPEKTAADGKSEDALSSPVEARYVRTTILESHSISQREWLGMSEQRIETAEI